MSDVNSLTSLENALKAIDEAASEDNLAVSNCNIDSSDDSEDDINI